MPCRVDGFGVAFKFEPAVGRGAGPDILVGYIVGVFGGDVDAKVRKSCTHFAGPDGEAG